MADIIPIAAALHTRYEQPELDYNWYIEKTENALLFNKTKEIYRDLVRDRKGEAPRLILISTKIQGEEQRQRIGVLVGNMESPTRRDYLGGLIYDTLYLEFDGMDKAQILASTATILSMKFNDGKYEKGEIDSFLEYAEKLSSYKDNSQAVSLEPIILTIQPSLNEKETHFKSEIALPSTQESRDRCAAYLKMLAEKEQSSVNFVLVSTGRVGLDQIQQYANKNKSSQNQLIILTLSDSVAKETDLRSLREKQEDTISRVSTAGKTTEDMIVATTKIMGAIVDSLKKNPKHSIWIILPIGLLISLIYWTSLDRQPPQLASVAFATVNRVLKDTAQLRPIVLPRTKTTMPLILDFDEPMNVQALPTVEIAGKDIPIKFHVNSCIPKGQTSWECPVSIAPIENADPNKEIFFNLQVQSGQDKAKNDMSAQLIPFKVEDAGIEIISLNTKLLRIPVKIDSQLVYIRTVIQSRYGIAEVFINNTKSVQQALNDNSSVWGVFLPSSLNQEDITITIKDANGNIIEEHKELALE